MNLHQLKIKKEFYLAVASGLKTFEIRKNDRNFQIGDLIHFVPVQENKTFTSFYEAMEFEKRSKIKVKEKFDPIKGGMVYEAPFPITFTIPEDEVWQITYVLKDIPEYGLDKEYCILGIRRLVNEK